jgi:hypothetical protein
MSFDLLVLLLIPLASNHGSAMGSAIINNIDPNPKGCNGSFSLSLPDDSLIFDYQQRISGSSAPKTDARTHNPLR